MSLDDVVDVQRVLSALVEREVVYNVSCLVYELGKVTGEISYNRDNDINDENLRELMICPATYLEAAENSGYSVVEHGGEYYWYEDGEPVPFKDAPKGYSFKRRVKQHGNPGWGWRSDDDEEWQGCLNTKAEAIEDAWERGVKPPAFDTDEDAAENCCKENGIDRCEYDHDVYEHWIVTSFFGRQLREYGEHVVEFCGMTIWCRCCTGQAISMDGVIKRIARSMEILPGMRNDWSKKD